MRSSTTEKIIRVGVVPESAKPLQIFDVLAGRYEHPRIARECRWIVVTQISGEPQRQAIHLVYYVDSTGHPGEADEFDSLEEALAQVENMTGLRERDLSRVSLARVGPDQPKPWGRFDPSWLRGVCDSAGPELNGRGHR